MCVLCAEQRREREREGAADDVHYVLRTFSSSNALRHVRVTNVGWRVKYISSMRLSKLATPYVCGISASRITNRMQKESKGELYVSGVPDGAYGKGRRCKRTRGLRWIKPVRCVLGPHRGPPSDPSRDQASVRGMCVRVAKGGNKRGYMQ